MVWSVAAPATWAAGCSCALAVTVLWTTPHTSSSRLRAIFCVYLIAHTFSTVPAIIRASNVASASTDTALDLISSCFVLIAGHSYFLLGAALLAPNQPQVWHGALVATAGILSASLASLFVLHFAADSATSSVVFIVYASACVVGFIGVLATNRRHSDAWQPKLLLFSAVCGAVNGLLPTFADAGAPIWQPAFLGRLLDVILWLPGAVLALRWLDGQPGRPREATVSSGGGADDRHEAPRLLPTAAKSRARGYTLATAGVLLVTPDALLVRVSRLHGGSFWWTIAAKCAFQTLIIMTFVCLQHGWRQLPAGLRAGPFHCGLVIVCQGSVTILFPAVFQTTSAAKGLLLISLNPLWAALFGWRVLGDQLPRRTMLAIAGAFLCIGGIFVPPAIMGEAESEEAVAADGVGNWRGDILAVLTGLALAGMITSTRYGAQQRPKALMALAAAMGSMCAGLTTLVIACAFAWEDAGQLQPLFWPVMFADAACISACTVLTLTFAPRHISPAEVALVLLLEVALGPLWVTLGGFEVPSAWTVAGGGGLILVLAMHELAALHDARRVRLPRGTSTAEVVLTKKDLVDMDASSKVEAGDS